MGLNISYIPTGFGISCTPSHCDLRIWKRKVFHHVWPFFHKFGWGVGSRREACWWLLRSTSAFRRTLQSCERSLAVGVPVFVPFGPLVPFGVWPLVLVFVPFASLKNIFPFFSVPPSITCTIPQSLFLVCFLCSFSVQSSATGPSPSQSDLSLSLSQSTGDTAKKRETRVCALTRKEA